MRVPPSLGLASLHDGLGDGLAASPHESLDAKRPEIQRLFELALEAKLPRARELKPYEPLRLNERHLSMVMMRAGGLKQREIAKAFEATDSNVSIILNHPDADYLLTRLQAMRATAPTEIEERLMKLGGPAMDSLEAVFSSEASQIDFKRAPLAFRLLELNGHGRAKKVEHTHDVTLSANGEQLNALTQAIRESSQIPALQHVEITSSSPLLPPPGGELPASPPRSLSSDASAPSVGGSQEVQDA